MAGQNNCWQHPKEGGRMILSSPDSVLSHLVAAVPRCVYICVHLCLSVVFLRIDTAKRHDDTGRPQASATNSRAMLRIRGCTTQKPHRELSQTHSFAGHIDRKST